MDNLLPDGFNGWMGAEFCQAQSAHGFLKKEEKDVMQELGGMADMQVPRWGGWIPDKNGR